MLINISKVEFTDKEISIKNYGFVEDSKFDLMKIFNLCNWDAWCSERPNIMKNCSLSQVGSGLVIENTVTNKIYLSLPFGWKEYNTFEEIIKDIKENIIGKMDRTALMASLLMLEPTIKTGYGE
ncbi:hypothetical protein U729_3170 (plasmid) [Clostridium baratii str. Sullivan]|uniref:Uncharacterized protein n=1 Tax=Clostridium baratii str. Sullivan TaxID=1415775 RepID=A0A0A7G2K9_9CLOT|nr:hypothetical protein [Clostridium baratii]AIY85256.1 hypothetical protein U729_3170 [Clostridium baratii str. Sullivan]